MKTNVMENMMIGFEELLNQLHRPYVSYPPYNVIKTENGYLLELAVAGFDRSELEVTLDGGELIVRGTKNHSNHNSQYLYQGLAHRSWTRKWAVDPHLVVQSASLVNGVLTITMLDNQFKSETITLEIN